MATYNAQIAVVASGGTVNYINPKTTAANVSCTSVGGKTNVDAALTYLYGVSTKTYTGTHGRVDVWRVGRMCWFKFGVAKALTANSALFTGITLETTYRPIASLVMSYTAMGSNVCYGTGRDAVNTDGTIYIVTSYNGVVEHIVHGTYVCAS